MPSSTVEDYLKAVYRLSKRGSQLAPLGMVASGLGVTPGTATTMVKQIARQGFIDYVPRKGVKLTPEGRREVMGVLRRHRLIELFLVEKLGYDWAEVHDEAEVLEHAVSERLIDRIDSMLGFPDRDPHGDPIPDGDGNLRDDDQSVPLAQCDEGVFEVVSIREKTDELLAWLSKSGIEPGEKVELLGHDPFPDVYMLRVVRSEKIIHLGQQVIDSLWVIDFEA